MASSQRDENFIPNIAGVSSITFTGTVEPAVNPTTHALLVENTSATTDQEVDVVKVGGSAFALGQQLAASSLPIVLTANQLTTLTPPAAITGFATSAKQDTLLTELQLKADLTETQPVDVQAISTIYNGTKTVPTDTAEAIAGSQTIKSVTIKTLSTNTVAVYVGATGCTTATGFELLAGESVSLDVNNLALVYVISGSASQVIRYIAI